jgi:hypothetical protein
MKLERQKAMPDNELAQVIRRAQGEVKARAEKRKRKTIAKIQKVLQERSAWLSAQSVTCAG